jgi:hypothetical protein
MLLRHAGFDLVRDALVPRFVGIEQELRRSVEGAVRSREEVLSSSMDRAVEAMRVDPFTQLWNAQVPWADTRIQFERAVAGWAQRSEWFSDEIGKAAALELYSDFVDQLDPDEVEFTPAGDVIVEGQTIPSAEVEQGLAEAARITDTLAAEAPLTKQDFAEGLENLRRELAPKVSTRVLGVIVSLTLGVIGNRIDHLAFESPAPTLSAAPAAAIAETSSSDARLFRVTATSLHLREEASTKSGIIITLDNGELVHLVEYGEDGWVLVRARMVQSSFEQGWVWKGHLEPVQ